MAGTKVVRRAYKIFLLGIVGVLSFVLKTQNEIPYAQPFEQAYADVPLNPGDPACPSGDSPSDCDGA